MGFADGALGFGFSDQGYLVEWVVWQCPLVLLPDVGIHLSCVSWVSCPTHFIDEELVLEMLHLFCPLLEVFSAP